MNKQKMIVVGIAVLLLLAGVIFLANQSNTPESQTVKEEAVTEEKSTESGVMESTDVEGTMEKENGEGLIVKEEKKTFEVEASSFKFSLPTIQVKKDDTVKINLTVKEGFHDWVIDEFNARTKQIAVGSAGTVEFVADKAGTFEYYCSVGNHRAQGMVGKLIVE